MSLRAGRSNRERYFSWTLAEVLPLLTMILPVLLLLVLPSLTWGPGTANVGGDVPNTLFLDPGSFIAHVIGQHTGNGLAGTDNFLPYLSLAVIAFILKSVGLAPQLVISGLVLALTYLGVYLLVLTILPRRLLWKSQISAAIGASVAALAPLIAQTFWTNFEPRLYLLPLAPWLIYALIQFIRKGSARYLVAGAIMVVVTSAGIADIPGALSVFSFVGILLAMLIWHEHLVAWIYVRRLAIFVGVVALVNFYWLVPFSFGLFAGQAQAVYSTSASGRQAAVALAASLIPYQQLSDVLSLRVSVRMMESFSWSQLSFSSWYQRWWLVGYLPFAIGFGGLSAELVLPDRQRENRKLVIGLFALSLVMLGFVTLTFPPGAREFFDFLTLHLPGWVAEKNFYETFAIPFVLAVALASSAGFYVLTRFVSHKIAITVGLVVVILVAIFGEPLLAGEPYRNPYYATSPANRVLSSLPSGYMSAVSRITKSGAAPVLSLPLLQPAWTYLVGQESNGGSGTYIGIPPLYYLYGIPDFVGVSSFASTTDPNFSTNLDDAIANGRADVFARVVRMLGVRWVISDLSVVHQVDFQTINSESTPTASLSFAREVEKDLDAVKVLKNGKYSLLEVPRASSSSVVSVDRATKFSLSSGGISEVAAGFYNGPMRSACPSITGGGNSSAVPEVSADITRNVSSDSCFVALRVPYSTLWSATLVENGRSIHLEHRQVYGFANGFMIPALGPGKITIHFSDQSSFYAGFGAVISLGASVFSLVGFFMLARRRRRNEACRLLDASEIVVM
jgi:hypothetical protein